MRFHDSPFFAGGFFGTDGGRGSGRYKWTEDEINLYLDGMSVKKKKEEKYEIPNYLDRYWTK